MNPRPPIDGRDPPRGSPPDMRALHVPGLDMERGLSYVSGNQKLYLSLLGTFVRDFSHACERVLHEIERGDVGSAKRLVHTIKGLAGTLGASDVQVAATELDDVMKAVVSGRQTVDDAKPAISSFAAVMDPFIEALRRSGIDGVDRERPTVPSSTKRAGSEAPLFPPFAVMVVDDDESMVQIIQGVLASVGITNVLEAGDGELALTRLQSSDVGVALLDLTLPGKSGLEMLPLIANEFPDLPVIIVTADNDIQTAVECMRLGAFDYVVKGGEPSKLIATVKMGIELQQLRRENRNLSERFFSAKLEHPQAFSKIVTRDQRMRAVFAYIEAIANSPSTVLITGETGTGKELVAEAIHLAGARPGEFVAANVAGYDDALFADALFGHLKGAFTGADRARSGLIQRATGGTLFLDEIGDLSHPSQVKLLRLLEAQEYFPVGSDVPKRTDARIVVATNCDLETAVEEGDFRKDLYYRLYTHRLQLPPLRDRGDDIQILFDRFLSDACQELGKELPNYPPHLIALLKTHDFPGNIREMRALVFDAVSRHKSGELSMDAFTQIIGHDAAFSAAMQPVLRFSDPLPTIKEATGLLITEAIERSGGNQTVAARVLGISQPALSQRLKNSSR